MPAYALFACLQVKFFSLHRTQQYMHLAATTMPLEFRLFRSSCISISILYNSLPISLLAFSMYLILSTEQGPIYLVHVIKSCTFFENQILPFSQKQKSPILLPKIGVYLKSIFFGGQAVSSTADPRLCAPKSPRVCSFRKIQSKNQLFFI